MLDLNGLGIGGNYSATELVNDTPVRVDGNNMFTLVPAGRTQVIRIINPK